MPDYANLFFQIFSLGLHPGEKFTEPFASHSSIPKVYGEIDAYLKHIEESAEVEKINKNRLYSRFSRCYLFLNFDTLMEEMSIEVEGELLNSEKLRHILLMWHQLLQVSDRLLQQPFRLRSAALSEYSSLKFDRNPFLSSFLSYQIQLAESFMQKMRTTNLLGQPVHISDLVNLLGDLENIRTQGVIRAYLFRGIYDDVSLRDEGRRGTKLIKQKLFAPLIILVAPRIHIPTEQEWDQKHND